MRAARAPHLLQLQPVVLLDPLVPLLQLLLLQVADPLLLQGLQVNHAPAEAASPCRPPRRHPAGRCGALACWGDNQAAASALLARGPATPHRLPLEDVAPTPTEPTRRAPACAAPSTLSETRPERGHSPLRRAHGSLGWDPMALLTQKPGHTVCVVALPSAAQSPAAWGWGEGDRNGD